MLYDLLTETQEALLAEERAVLADLARTLARLDVVPEDQETFERSLRQLDELFLLVIVGEFNAGKSAFINALLGARVLEEGVTPTTARIGLLKYGPQMARLPVGAGLDVMTAPVPLLREINIVDTPGANAINREHEALTRDFVPRSDLVLFVTSADRPFTESERAFLQEIREWGKKVVVAVNKIDILETAAEVDEVVAFVTTNAQKLLGLSPQVFPVSARQALRGKTGPDAALLEASRFESLERYVAATLDESERLRLKLQNPLGVGTRLVDRHLQRTEERLGLLREDEATVEGIEDQLRLYAEDMARDFRFRLADVNNVLLDLERRGTRYFEETMRVGRVFDLLKPSRIKSEYERVVVADLPRLVERRVEEIIDWMVASELRQWKGVMEHLDRRPSARAGEMVGRVGGVFEQDRARLLETVRRESQRALESFDHNAEADRLAESVREAVAGTALIQVGALGLGTMVTVLATTTLADVTGILAAGAISILGLLVIPARRQKAQAELHTKVVRMSEDLMRALTGQFDQELARSLQRIREAVGPYTRFVRGERERLGAIRDDLRRIGDGLARVQARVQAL